MANQDIKLVSLFSGCGGLDLGFEMAGFKRVWANDFDKDAQAVFRLNLGEIDGRDIRDVPIDDIPACDILTAGFPCQPFSNAGNRKGVHDARGLLYQECLRIIGAKLPKVIVFENVKGLLSTKYEDGKKLGEVICEDLNNLGYKVTYELVNASDYGVPQNRQRVFFVGIRKTENKEYRFPEKQSREELTLRNVLDIPADVPNQVDWKLSPQALSMIAHIPEGGSWKDIPYEELAPRFKKIRDNMQRYHSPNFYRRFGRDEINGTITASAQPENCGIIHPVYNRRYTIREIARIQTFPDDFIFIDDSVKNISAMYKVIGNAVPVKLAYAIADSIKKQVFEKSSRMNSDKAYLLGLIVGGGIFGGNQSFQIRLPYRQWGDITQNPARAGKIAGDILKVVKPMMKSSYGLDVFYQESLGEWLIIMDGDILPLKNELLSYGIKPEGEIREHATLKGIAGDLIDDNLKRRFIAGLADTIGSMAKSHRRFSDKVQIISFEIKGYEYDFVYQLCRLLYSIHCYPDQILWNHPNFHSGNDSYYASWKKGFKLRVELDQYAKFGAFAFRTKAESANENISLQAKTNVAAPCEERVLAVKESCVHMDEGYDKLPEEIRGGHYFHNKHICAVLGCEHAPYEQIDRLIQNAGRYINPFPVLCKGTEAEIKSMIARHSIYANRNYEKKKVDAAELYRLYKAEQKSLIWGNDSDSGYPVNVMIQALAFLIAAHNGELKGYRTKGNQDRHIQRYIEEGMPFAIMADIPDLMTPIVLTCDGYSAMVGPKNPKVYDKLVRRDEKNKYKIYVREITEDDLNGETKEK